MSAGQLSVSAAAVENTHDPLHALTSGGVADAPGRPGERLYLVPTKNDIGTYSGGSA